jgi:hypothetical protein
MDALVSRASMIWLSLHPSPASEDNIPNTEQAPRITAHLSICCHRKHREIRSHHQLFQQPANAVRDFVNARVHERLRDLWAYSGRNPANVIRFVDLDYETYPQLRPLKIIATDIPQMRPVLFDRIRTPNVPIGDAVAASIAIPIVFRPVAVRGLPNELGQALFVDGGLVSNLPFWVSPNLPPYARAHYARARKRDLFQTLGIGVTVNLDHAKRHYYESHRTINPTGIVPKGPILDFTVPHDRAALARVSTAA